MSSALQEHKDLGAQPGMASALTGLLTSKDGVHLYYAKVGSGTKTVIIVPGRLFAFRDFQGLAKGRTLIFCDMRNRGRSDAVLATFRRKNDDREKRFPEPGPWIPSGATIFSVFSLALFGGHRQLSHALSRVRCTRKRPILIRLSAITPKPTHRCMPASPR